MTNSQLLNEAIIDSGLKITYIANRLGITREGFYNKLKNETEFKASEIVVMQKILNLSNSKRDKIFFAEEVELKSTQSTEP